MNTLPVEMLDLKSLEVLDFVERKSTPAEDERLSRSIQQGGIQEPLIVVRHRDAKGNERTLLVKGSRRRRIALSLGTPLKARCVIDRVPDGISPESYIRQLRFILHEHRQDLLPSVRAGVIERLKETLKLNNVQVAAYLGVDQDTITNWQAVLRLIPEVVTAIDSGALTLDVARVFNGMSKEGQRAIWAKHHEEMCGPGRGGTHKRLRDKYPPTKFPSYYEDPEKIAARLGRAKKKRVAPINANEAEKRRMMRSHEIKDTELKELKAEVEERKKLCQAYAKKAVIIRRGKHTWATLSESEQEELERFIDVYA